jgi:predicted amidohydrolase YtcJ
MGKLKAIRCNQIYTACSSVLRSGYVIIQRNKIQGIISEQEWDQFVTDHKDIQVFDYTNGFLMPGFNDYHVHAALAGMMEYFGTLRFTKNPDQAAEFLYIQNKNRDPNQWILGGAWDHLLWPGQKLPTKEILDKYFPRTPVFLLNRECHGAWLNSEALKRFGITNKTPDPTVGEYFKDKNGELTGYVHELAVVPLLKEIFSTMSDETIAEFIKSFAKKANSLGITSVGDLPAHGIMREGAYKILLDRGDMTIRVDFSVGMQENIETITKIAEEFQGPIVKFNGVKDFLDGTPMGRTGYMVEPYSDMPGFTSEPIISPESLIQRVEEMDRNNIKVRIHCCGDGAVRLALDAFENARKVNGFKDIRHAIEHIEVITPQDIDRFAKLHVIASVQPEHTPRTRFSEHPFHNLLGPQRIKYTWAFKSIMETGASMAFGSDNPVVELTPFKGLFRAVNRLTNELEPKGGFNPGEKLSVHEALRNYTYGSAYAANREDELGTIEEGKLADLVVLDKNPFEEIGNIDVMFNLKVRMTMMDGEIVYQG